MKRNCIHSIFLVFLGIVFVLTMNSCATIFGGKRNTIHVKMGSPENAMVYLDGELIGEAPFKIRIEKRRIQEGSIIEIKKEGYHTMQYHVIRSPHAGYVILDILGGVIPLVVDVADGNIYRPNTRKIEYVLLPYKEETKSLISKPEPQKK